MRRLILLPILLFAASAFAHDFDYVYSRGGPATISRGSLENLLRLRHRFTGTYIWVKHDGREYLIRDDAVLAQTAEAFKPLEAFGPKVQALNDKMKPLEARQDALEREIESHEDEDDDFDATDLERQLREVERQLGPFEREQSRLERIEESLEREFEAKLEKMIERAIASGVAKRLR